MRRPRAATAAMPRASWSHGRRCHMCAKAFGFVTRRHHCRRCGRSVCGRHSKHKASMLVDSNMDERQPQRVCNACHEDMTSFFSDVVAVSHSEDAWRAALQAQERRKQSTAAKTKREDSHGSLYSTFASAPTMVAYSSIYPPVAESEDDSNDSSSESSADSTTSVSLDDIYETMRAIGGPSHRGTSSTRLTAVRSSRGSYLSLRSTLDFAGCVGHDMSPREMTLGTTVSLNDLVQTMRPTRSQRLELALGPSSVSEHTLLQSQVAALRAEHAGAVAAAQAEYALYSDAVEDLLKARRRLGRRRWRLHQHAHEATALHSAHEYFLAQLQYKLALCDDPTSPALWLGLIMCLLGLGRIDEADEAIVCCEAWASPPCLPSLRALQGDVELRRGNYDAAVTYLRAAIAAAIV
ncbi:hypothetical protein SDRG_01784 [Saprolegnia diclina VS20]|uniref:FYVE-type domain-containing protein n=1 Tax=Saprolegnia diclina (strain VS20) TaxID=1156394 RepID=T0SCV8_SAPDV|nr:hypothetical protein SDRG_01784 [Saprolegnia diclina VS20]EQC40712.1 hypothetical protein SDRG_01784 [Saprolegnia diclina VS20]|eukprot:XP_008605556.1 hypothetical protein SDRG_01784 [Saprolegnia diclina VS20]